MNPPTKQLEVKIIIIAVCLLFFLFFATKLLVDSNYDTNYIGLN